MQCQHYLRKLFLDNECLQVYLTLHSYSQMWLVPWSHTKKLADDYDDMMYLARQATEAIQKVHGSQYRLGTTPSLLYTTSGII